MTERAREPLADADELTMTRAANALLAEELAKAKQEPGRIIYADPPDPFDGWPSPPGKVAANLGTCAVIALAGVAVGLVLSAILTASPVDSIPPSPPGGDPAAWGFMQ